MNQLRVDQAFRSSFDEITERAKTSTLPNVVGVPKGTFNGIERERGGLETVDRLAFHTPDWAIGLIESLKARGFPTDPIDEFGHHTPNGQWGAERTLNGWKIGGDEDTDDRSRHLRNVQLSANCALSDTGEHWRYAHAPARPNTTGMHYLLEKLGLVSPPSPRITTYCDSPETLGDFRSNRMFMPYNQASNKARSVIACAALTAVDLFPDIHEAGLVRVPARAFPSSVR